VAVGGNDGSEKRSLHKGMVLREWIEGVERQRKGGDDGRKKEEEESRGGEY